MTEKELKQSILKGNISSNIFLGLKIIFDLLPQLFLVYLLQYLSKKHPETKILYWIFFVILLCFVFKAIMYYFATKNAHENAYQSLTEIRVKITEHLKQLPFGFFKEHSSGELTKILQHDVEQIEIYLAHGLPEIMVATLLPAFLFIGMLLLDYRLAFVMILGIPLLFLVKFLSKKSMGKNFNLYFQQETKMRKELMDYVKNISVIKAFSKEEMISSKTLKTAREYVYWIKKSMLAVSLPFALIDIFMEIGVVLVMIYGLFLLSKNEISSPSFILSLILSSAFTSAISKAATLQHFSIVFHESLKSISTILLSPLPRKKIENNLNFGDIVFQNVSFQYGKDGFSLKNISCSLKANWIGYT